MKKEKTTDLSVVFVIDTTELTFCQVISYFVFKLYACCLN